MKESTYNYLIKIRHDLDLIYSLFNLQIELNERIPCVIYPLHKEFFNSREFINVIRKDFYAENYSVNIEIELDVLYDKCLNITNVWNHVKQLQYSNTYHIYCEQNGDFEKPLKNVLIEKMVGSNTFLCELGKDSIFLDNDYNCIIEYFYWRESDLASNQLIEKWEKPSYSTELIPEQVISDCNYGLKYLAEILKKDKDTPPLYVEYISLIDNQLLSIYNQEYNFKIDFEKTLKRLFRYTDKKTVRDKLTYYRDVFNDLSNITSFFISNILEIKALKGQECFLIDVEHNMDETLKMRHQYIIPTEGKKIDDFKEEIVTGATLLLTQKLYIYTQNEEIIDYYNQIYLGFGKGKDIDLSRTFAAQFSRIISKPYLIKNKEITFEEYCKSLLLSQKEESQPEEQLTNKQDTERDNDTLNIGSIKYFKDIFKTDEAYLLAKEQLLELNFMSGDELIASRKSDFVRIISSLYLFGYLKKIPDLSSSFFVQLAKILLAMSIDRSTVDKTREYSQNDTRYKLKQYTSPKDQ